MISLLVSTEIHLLAAIISSLLALLKGYSLKIELDMWSGSYRGGVGGGGPTKGKQGIFPYHLF